MLFNLRRLLHAIVAHRFWMLLALLPAIAYLAAAATAPDRFRISQKVAIGSDTPVSVEDTPIDFLPLKEMASRDDRFFEGNFTLIKLSKHLETVPKGTASHREFSDLRTLVSRAMSLQLLPGNIAQVTYEGQRRALGEQLVAFYAGQLISRGEDGLKRQVRQEAGGRREASPEVRKTPAVGEGLHLAGQPQIEEMRALFRPERLATVAWLLMLGAILMVALIGLREWGDPSFKSERQVARYLDVKILGSLPDLHKIPLVRARSG